MTSKALYNEVGKTATDNYDWTVSFNGDPVKYDGENLSANKTDDDKDFVQKALGGDARTGNGVVTEVYVDGTDKTVDVATAQRTTRAPCAAPTVSRLALTPRS